MPGLAARALSGYDAELLARVTARGGPGRAMVNVSSSAATLGSVHEYVHYTTAQSRC